MSLLIQQEDIHRRQWSERQMARQIGLTPSTLSTAHSSAKS